MSPQAIDPEDVEAAVEKAIRVLNAASQTRSGLSQKLKRAGYLPAVVEAASARMEALGYVNDRAYGDAVVQKRQRQGRGVKVIASELHHKGIDTELIDEILSDIDPSAEVERAAELAARLMRRHAGEPAVRQREHVISGLMRRGFTSGIARRALERTLISSSPLDS
jgi:regulatory protein